MNYEFLTTSLLYVRSFKRQVSITYNLTLITDNLLGRFHQNVRSAHNKVVFTFDAYFCTSIFAI